MDDPVPSKHEQRFLREVQLRSPAAWRSRRRFVLGMTLVLTAVWVAGIALGLGSDDRDAVRLVTPLGLPIVLLFLLHNFMGLMQGAVEHHARQDQP